jgi:hypothetical protein
MNWKGITEIKKNEIGMSGIGSEREPAGNVKPSNTREEG